MTELGTVCRSILCIARCVLRYYGDFEGKRKPVCVCVRTLKKEAVTRVVEARENENWGMKKYYSFKNALAKKKRFLS